MANLKFADTHNMVAFLSKPTESEGFEQIAKTINGEVQLHALVDGKKIIVTEASMRRDLQLEDAEGIDCLPNSTIFEELTRMGAKTTAWNEFSSTMASAIICLATNQKFNFSKYIFESMVRNLDNLSGKFLMYPRFVQVFLNQQLSDLSTHNGIYIAPSHTKKIFGNMRRVGKGFSGRVTPLFPTMVVQNQFELGKDEVVHKELGDSLVRAATTTSSLEAEQDSGNITKTRYKATPNESSSLGTTSGGGPRRQETMGDTIAQTSLKRRVKKLEKKRRSRTHGLKRLYKVGLTARVESSGDEEDLGEDASKQGRRVNAIDADEGITLVNVQDDADKEMFDVDILNCDEVFAEQEVAAKDMNLTVDEVTLAQALETLKSVKSKVKGDVIEEPSVPVSVASASTKVSAATTTTAIIATPRKEILAKRLQAEEQEQFTIEEKATLFKELLVQRRKHFAAKRAKEKRIKPPTKTQQKKIMITYLKNMEGWKHNDLKSKDFDSIKELFDKAFTKVNMFVDFRTKLVEGSSKRAGEELEQESTKKQKVDEDKYTAKFQSLMEVIPDEEEVEINVVPLATKSPSIVDWKIHKEGKKSYYQIVRPDRKSQMYRVFSQMLKSFTREDLKDLYKLVKATYESTRLVEDLDLVLWNDLKAMFEPHVEDEIWKLQQKYKVLIWKLFDC
ncbi:hypothetical protein Tco_0304378 [Tanacetum coccineum]